MAKKKEIDEEIKGVFLDRYSFEGDISKLIDRLLEIRHDSINAGYVNIRIVLQHHSWSEDVDYTVVGNRLETDLELNKRVREEKKQKEANEKRRATNKEKRRKQYEKLRKEFDEGDGG